MIGKTGGFSLIELLIALSVAAILAGIAYPSYVGHLASARRADAEGALQGLQAAMERYFTVNLTYAGAAAGGGIPAPAVGYSSTVPIGGGATTYNLTIAAPTGACPAATCFELRASPAGTQTGDKCGILTLTSTGQRGMIGAKPGLAVSDCWRN